MIRRNLVTARVMLGKHITNSMNYCNMYFCSSYSPSQKCCYDSSGNVLTGTDGGNAYSVYPNNWESLIGTYMFTYTCT